MSYKFPHQILPLILLTMIGLLSGLASAQSPEYKSLSDASGQQIVQNTQKEIQPIDQCCGRCEACCCCPVRCCRVSDLVCAAKHRIHQHVPRGTFGQRYPYQAFQMSYYARPYNASYYASVDPNSYSDDVFASAQLGIQMSLPPGTDLEFADGPRIPTPVK